MHEGTLNGWAVKALREALGIEAGKFASECLMSSGQLSSIETGRKSASGDAARRIVTALERHYAAAIKPTHRSRPVDMKAALSYQKDVA